MIAMFYLLYAYLKKSFHTIFFGFVFPIIMLLIFVAILPGTASQVLPGLAISSASVLGIVTLAMSYSDFKQSIIIKRIGATPLRSWQFVASIIIFHVVLIFISSSFIIAVGIALYSHDLNLSQVNWGFIFLSMFFAAFISSSIGLMVGILAPDFKVANAFAMLLYLPTAFLSGQYIPYSLIKNQEALVIIAKILPFSYPVSIMNSGWSYYSAEPLPSMFSNILIPIGIAAAWMIGLIVLVTVIYKYRKK